MRDKRTSMDFSEHVHRVEIFKNDKGDEIQIDHFQVGNSRMNYIQLINTDETMTVTGDFGNWVFCRPFVPSPKGGVSDHYWFEKLSIASEQRFDQLDSESIAKEIQELIDHGLEEYGYDGDELKDAKEWFTELLREVDDKLEYEYKAFRCPYKPDFIDYEEIPYYMKTPVWLDIIFDAFDEICRRLKEEENLDN